MISVIIYYILFFACFILLSPPCRFFFKTRCEDLDNPVIQEEVNSDSEPLPLFEGKVMGTVKPSE